MSEDDEDISIIELLGVSEGSSCGYCKNRKELTKRNLGETKGNGDGNSISLGCAAYSINVVDLENLLLWGWRAWAHKLNVMDYLGLLNAGWRRSGQYLYKPDMTKTCCPQYTIRLDVDKFVMSRRQKIVLRNMQLYLQKGIKSKEEKEEMNVKKDKVNESGDNISMMNHKCNTNKRKNDNSEKKKIKRRKAAIERWIRKGLDVERLQRERKEKEERRRKSVEERMGNDYEDGYAHELKVELVKVGSNEYNERSHESYLLFKKYQESIHSDDDVSEGGYERFLVKSPLTAANPLMGSFHMRYIMDDILIGVGIVDILPHTLSATYLFYDPQYSFLSLGTYTALREIALVRKLKKTIASLKYYYMGYYISDCPKMRYKGSFGPSDLLCDRTLQWIPLSEADRMIAGNNNKFTVFNEIDSPAVRLDPYQCKLFQDHRVTYLNRLSPFVKHILLPSLNLYCNCVSLLASKIVLVCRELQQDLGDSD